MPSALYVAGKLIEGVTEGATRALPFLEQLSRQPISANEILRQAASAGLELRRSAGLAIIRQLREQVTGEEYIKAVRNDFLPNPSRIAYSVTDIRRNYSYRVRVSGRDTVSGEKSQFFVQVTSDSIMTKDQAYDLAATFIAENAENYTFEFEAATVVGAVKSPRLANI